MKMLRFTSVGLRASFLVAFLLSTLNFLPSILFAQGSLTPPGAPGPTMKTLDQVEARIIVSAANTPGDSANTFIISQPGSYYLTGNITGTPGKHGISIQANDVTLDLNGFALISGGGNVVGIYVFAAQTNFCLRNGSVRGWSNGGVRADSTVTLAEKLLLANNTGSPGLAVGNGSLIKDCVASGNGTGFYANDRTQIINCISTVNTGIGFYCTSYVTLIDCAASRNFGDAGIVVQASCTVTRCNASRNTGGSGNGIIAGDGCTIADCTAGSNGSNGISVDFGSTVRNCTTHANSVGILATNRCHLTGNTCDGNTDRGLRVSGTGNRIEGNSFTSNGIAGIQILGTNNLVIRNSGSGQYPNDFNWGSGNAVGPIVDMTAGGTITSTSPWANFSY